MPRPLHEQVVVITGASSGIGREAAVEFGRRGASVVLAARSWKPLRDVADVIEENGGKTYIAVTDVAEWKQVEKLARTTMEYFGRIDTWVNAAAVIEYAAVSEMSADEIQRVIQVTMMGQIFGMKAALPHMQEEGEGTIINLSSVLAKHPEPLLSAYCAAKQGVAGFTDVLRREIENAGDEIHLTMIVAPSINTPLYEHARARHGILPAPLSPVYTPNVVAEAILFAAEHPRNEITVGTGSGRLAAILERLTPRLAQHIMKNGDGTAEDGHSEQDIGETEVLDSEVSTVSAGRDNLFEPMPDTDRSEGRFSESARRTSPYTRIFGYHPALRRIAAAAFLTGAGLLLRRFGRSRG